MKFDPVLGWILPDNWIEHFLPKESPMARDFVAEMRSKATDCHESEEPMYLEWAAEHERLRNALTAIRDGYGPNHLSKFCRDEAALALPPRYSGDAV